MTNLRFDFDITLDIVQAFQLKTANVCHNVCLYNTEENNYFGLLIADGKVLHISNNYAEPQFAINNLINTVTGLRFLAKIKMN